MFLSIIGLLVSEVPGREVQFQEIRGPSDGHWKFCLPLALYMQRTIRRRVLYSVSGGPNLHNNLCASDLTMCDVHTSIP